MTEYVAKDSDDLISVIVPAYNDEKNIGRCLKLVVEQTYKNLEIIIVYLESPDKTLDIIKSFNDDRIKIVEQKEKLGIGYARNLGIKAVTGKYFGFVETDDRIPPNYFEKLHEAAVDSGADITMCEVVQIKNGKGCYYSQISENKDVTDLLAKIKLLRHGTTFDRFYRTEFIRKHDLRFPEKWRFEDNPWILRAFYYANHIRLVKGLFYLYFIEDYTKEYAEYLNGCVVPIAKDMYDFALEKDFSEEELKQVKRFILRSFAERRLLAKGVYKPLKQAIDGGWWLEHRRLKVLKKTVKNKIGEILCQKKS